MAAVSYLCATHPKQIAGLARAKHAVESCRPSVRASAALLHGCAACPAATAGDAAATRNPTASQVGVVCTRSRRVADGTLRLLHNCTTAQHARKNRVVCVWRRRGRCTALICCHSHTTSIGAVNNTAGIRPRPLLPPKEASTALRPNSITMTPSTHAARRSLLGIQQREG